MSWQFKKRSAKSVSILMLTAALVLLGTVKLNQPLISTSESNKLIAHFPFTFTESIDPVNIFTVGQQVVAEHSFAFTAKRSVATGLTDSVAHVTIDKTNNSLRISLKDDLRLPSGDYFSDSDLCASLRISTGGTTHAPYKRLLRRVICEPRTVLIEYSALPINLGYLLTVPDFSIFKSNDLPLTTRNARSTATGPYYPTLMSPEKIVLKRNRFFPANLVANTFDEAELNSYSASESQELLSRLNPGVDSAVYFYGYSLEQSDLDKLKMKGYDVAISPHEWLLYLKINDRLSGEAKNALIRLAHDWRSRLKSTFGEPTTSVTQFSDEVLDNQQTLLPSYAPLAGQRIYTLDTWAKTPVFASLLEFLKTAIPGLQIHIVTRKNIGDLYSDKTKISLNLVGLSPVDKLSHLAFLSATLADFAKIISPDEIAKAAVIDSPIVYESKLREFDARIARSRTMLPIAHFPGIVAVSEKFSIDRTVSFDWGIQLWSLRKK